ncbi:hypothetical protein QVD17_02668 [Tagetes erecta]|uniref:ABC-type xenobiotic transporter n=1 Tax=Tagetes erecta TaxID=13708 RepID=A0AAD8L9V6_TARER|nr:hypothetical protein QVD17_02668 [Tagetes erecta]
MHRDTAHRSMEATYVLNDIYNTYYVLPFDSSLHFSILAGDLVLAVKYVAARRKNTCSMDSLKTLLGRMTMVSDGDFEFTRRSIIDIVNLVFVLLFYMLLLLGYIRRNNTNRSRKNDWITVSVALCCFLTPVSYLIACLWDATAKTPKLNWWVFIVRAFVWVTLTVSLLIERFASVKILATVWWVFFFLSISFVTVENLSKSLTILDLVLVEWAASFLLLLCALRNFKKLITRYTQSQTLSEPLLFNETLDANTSQPEEPSFLSKLTFSWVNPLLAVGYRKPLALEDIPCLASVDQAAIAHEKFTKAWDSLHTEKNLNNANMVLKALAKVYFKEMVFSGLCILVRNILVVVSPLLLYAFVDYNNREVKDLHHGLLLVGCLIVVKVIESLSNRQFFFNAKRTGMRMRSALMVKVYEKQLKLSNLGKKRHSTGEVVNYIAIDAYRMGDFAMWFHFGWSYVIQLFLSIGILFSIVGLGVLPGLFPLFVCGLLNVPFAKAMQKCQLQFMAAQDKRLRSTSEILNNMKVIKLQSWEEKFKKITESFRETEVHWLRESQFKRVFGTVLYWMSPTLVSSFVFFGCVLLKTAPLDAATIFTILASLRTMSEPVRMLPDALSALIQVKVSFDRINSFLVDDELKDTRMETNQEREISDACIKIQDGNFSWDPESPIPTLTSINLEVKHGQKVAVCGSVGAGKSSILYSILGEMSKTSGTVSVYGSIAYVSQTSWIQSGTIQDNILYGKPMDRTKYEKAIKACALDKDIEAFSHGDLTEIGQRGLNMSGGQKQRIQLARAVYNDADIYLLDDPFSAVDAHTAATLFNDCVMTCLEGKTVILVTHQVEFLSSVDDILVMQNGQITQSGNYEKILMAGTAFELLVNAHKEAIAGLNPSPSENKTTNMHQSLVENDNTYLKKEKSEGQLVKGTQGVQLTEDEEKETGNVGWKPFVDYVVVSEGSWFLSLSVLSQTGFVALQAAASYWLAFGIQIPKVTSIMLICGYTLLSTVSTLFVFFRSFFSALLGLKASKLFFSKFTDSIFSAPMVFFDSTPVGRILTRASSDLSVIDFDIPFSLSYVIGAGVELLAMILIMASVTWQVLIVAIFSLVATNYAQGYYLPNARELMRINGTTKAPVMNYASETSLGVATIRAFKMQDRFFKEYLKLVDTDASTFFFSNATLEWLILRIETLSNLTLFTASFLLVLIPNGFVPSGRMTMVSDGDFEFTRRSIIDIVNLVFVLLFYMLLLLGYIRRNNTNRSRKNDWITVSVALCCFLTPVSYLIACLWDATAKTPKLNWWVFIVRAFVWVTLTVSLLIERFASVKILATVWWVFFFLSISFVTVENLSKSLTILDLVLVEWAASFLLLLCALRNFKKLITRYTQSQTLSEPLLFNETLDANTSQPEEPSFLSKLTFSWVNPLLAVGYRKPLALEDIPCLASVDQAAIAHEKFTKAWDSLHTEKNLNNANMVLKALAKVYFKEMVFSGLCILVRNILVVVSPLLLYAFVDYNNREVKDLHHGLLLVGCLIVVKVIESLSNRQFFFNAKRTGMRMRSALMVKVYEKQLKLSNLGKKRHSTGEVVNYIAIDAYRMGDFAMWFHFGWSYVIQLFLSIGILFSIVGLGVLPGLFPLFVCGLLNVPFAKAMQKCQLQFMAAQDKRLRSTSEILNNMKVIKLQSWEEKFKKITESFRETEVHWLRESQFKRVFGTVLYWMSPTLVSSFVFFGCVLLKTAPLDAATIFTILASLRTMSEPVRMLPDALSALIQVKVSFDRINSFLVDDELKDTRMETNQEREISDACIKIQDGNFSWDPESPIPTLTSINLEVKHGQKVAVCGSVGAGKSSILYSILGEMSKTSGTVSVYGSIAYVSQTSWIQSGTIQDNILYGKPMDRTKYEKAIKACALDKDIEAFSHGDLTEIGQRGLNMSGGQKQRIQLARAVYNDADIYLLDDPFSAVDAHTAATLFNDCVMTCLEGKTVILVTHQVEFLSSVDDILVMQNGQITQSGNYEKILMAGTAFELLVNAHKEAIAGLNPSPSENKTTNMHQSLVENDNTYLKKEKSEGQLVKGTQGVQLTEDEEKETGNVGWKPFVDYVVVSEGSWFLSLSVLSQTGFVALQAAASYWLAFGIQIPKVTSIMLICGYTLLSTVSTLFVFFRSFFSALLGLKASKLFFSKFTDSIFSAPMVFFDSTPVGRILTRASSDLSVIDFDIPFSLSYVIGAGVELLAMILIMASVTWQVLIVAIFSLVATNYAQGYYLPNARELMRINGTTKAPVMNYASETSLGVATIRAFKMQDRFFTEYLKLVDTDASTFFFSNATLEWLILRIETLSNLTLFTASFLLVLIPNGFVPSGLVGLSLSYALTFTGTQVFLSRWYCSLANYIISVERIKQFMHIPPEPPAVVMNNRPPPSWPSKGRIHFEDLKLRYRPNAPLVLKGITCTFKEGTRVGIVGRTGSGKTTLITALFRLVEPDSGRILIDGLDICSIGLKDLRMNLSVIPQEPTLFRGSIRTNLDPLGLYSDDEIWKALEKCQLKTTITSLPNLLDSSVSDEGENWSAGQRQLFCLGRVLLRRNKILVLDEATASIDSATDVILQKIIREEFASCTVLTVAHRVPTVIDSDKVMVLSFGKMMEYDEPSKLMETDSFFSKLVAEYWSSCRKNSAHTFDDFHS